MIRSASFFLLALAGAPAAAQTTITLMHDNDEWAHTEQEYASGSRLSVVSAEWSKAPMAQILAGWLPGAEPGDTLSAGLGAGHYFYIPRDINTSAPLSNERPYSGWLHGSGLLIRSNATRQDTWKLDAGVVGPAALAEPLEKFFHGIFNGREMLGWDNQITDRLAANVSFERRWRNLIPIGDLALDFSPGIGFEAGSVSVAADAGFTLRFGANLDADFGAPRAGALGGSLSRAHLEGMSAYAFVSGNARYQAFDIFLDEPGGEDGDPVRGGSSITRGKDRTETSLGVVLANGGARLTFAWTEESKRYDQQLERQKYGEVTLGWNF
jgi:hypothetical protein